MQTKSNVTTSRPKDPTIDWKDVFFHGSANCNGFGAYNLSDTNRANLIRMGYEIKVIRDKVPSKSHIYFFDPRCERCKRISGPLVSSGKSKLLRTDKDAPSGLRLHTVPG